MLEINAVVYIFVCIDLKRDEKLKLRVAHFSSPTLEILIHPENCVLRR